MSDVITRKVGGSDIGRSSSYYENAVVSAVGSLADIDALDIVPPLLGGAVAGGATLLLRRFFGSTRPTLWKWAPALGALAGVVGSIPLYWWRGSKAVVSGAVTSVVTGGLLLGMEFAKEKGWSGSSPTSGIHVLEVNRKGVGMPVAQGGGAKALPSARIPRKVAPAIDYTAFGRRTY